MTKLKNSNCDKPQNVTKLKNWNFVKTQKLKLLQNLQTEIMTRSKTQIKTKYKKLQFLPIIKNQAVKKLKNSNCDKTQKLQL